VSALKYCNYVGNFSPIDSSLVESYGFFPSWVKDGDVYLPPVPWPTDGELWEWDEDSSNWVAVL